MRMTSVVMSGRLIDLPILHPYTTLHRWHWQQPVQMCRCQVAPTHPAPTPPCGQLEALQPLHCHARLRRILVLDKSDARPRRHHAHLQAGRWGVWRGVGVAAVGGAECRGGQAGWGAGMLLLCVWRQPCKQAYNHLPRMAACNWTCERSQDSSQGQVARRSAAADAPP